MGNYSELTNDQLNREIARRLKVTPVNKRWSTDLNDAWKLLPDIHFEQFRTEPGVLSTYLFYPLDCIPLEADKAARYISELWLEHQDTQEDN